MVIYLLYILFINEIEVIHQDYMFFKVQHLKSTKIGQSKKYFAINGGFSNFAVLFWGSYVLNRNMAS